MQVHFYHIFLLLAIFCGGINGQKVEATYFPMVNLEGETISLANYRGKVVYISFWASWCKPCISNFEKYKDIRQSLEKEGVILLNVSIDKRKEKWKQAMAKYNIAGDHVISKKEDLYPEYDISSIPLYEIINKEGFFVYLSDEVGRDILAQFRNWVEE